MRILGPADYEKHKEFLVPIVGGIEFFAPLSPDQLVKLLYFLRFVEFESGETVFEKGAPGDSFYIIHSGRAEARAPGAFGEKVLKVMGPGDFFGELALLLKQPRSATIVCAEPTRCFMMDQGDFALLLERNPEIAGLIRDRARERFENTGSQPPEKVSVPTDAPAPAPAPASALAPAPLPGAYIPVDPRGFAAQCPRCAAAFEAVLSTTLLGFRKSRCPACSVKIIYPLIPWVRTAYWLYLGFLGLVMLSRLASGVVSFPGILGVAVVLILARDARIRKALRTGGTAASGFPWKPLLIGLGCVLAAVFIIPALHSPSGKTAQRAAVRAMAAGDLQAAASHLDSYIAANPSDPEGYASRAMVRANLGNVGGAEEDALAAEKLRPGLPLVLAARCGILLARKEFAKAETECSSALSSAPSDLERSTLFHLTGVARVGLGKYRDALSSYNEALRLNANNAVARFSRGELRLMIGPVGDGIDDIAGAAKLWPALQSKADDALSLIPDIKARPILETTISNARSSLATLAKMELAYRRRYGVWAFTASQLASMTPDPAEFRKNVSAVFSGGDVYVKMDGGELVLSAWTPGVKRYLVTARGDENGFILPDLEWDGGDFEEEAVEGGTGTSGAAPPGEEKASPAAASGKKYASARLGSGGAAVASDDKARLNLIWDAQLALSKAYHALLGKDAETVAGLSPERAEMFAAMRKKPAWMDPEEGVLTQSQLWQAPVSILYEIMVVTSPDFSEAGKLAALRPKYNDACLRFGLTLERLKRSRQEDAFDGAGRSFMNTFGSGSADCGRLLKALERAGGGGEAEARKALSDLAGRSLVVAPGILGTD